MRDEEPHGYLEVWRGEDDRTEISRPTNLRDICEMLHCKHYLRSKQNQGRFIKRGSSSRGWGGGWNIVPLHVRPKLRLSRRHKATVFTVQIRTPIYAAWS
jgi:hypothetical protein